MNTPRICVSVTGDTTAEFEKNLEHIQNLKPVDIVELRVDYLSEVTPEYVTRLKLLTKKPAIFTCRHKQEGGNFRSGEQLRLALLAKAVDAGFEYVDVELATFAEHAVHRSPDTKLILSHHDFIETPDYWDLTKIVDNMMSYNPDIIKIATMVKKEKDIQALFRLLTNKRSKPEMIVIGMGQQGKVTRVLGPLLGSYLTFAASDKGSSAPGQVDVITLEKIYSSLSTINT